MNVNELVEKLKELAKPLAESVYDGDVYENWNSAEIKYGSVNIGLQSVSYDGSMCTYSVVLYYGDRLLQDKSNVNSIYTDGMNTLQFIINKINEEYTANIELPITYNFFEQKFMDYLAGVYTTIEITTESSIGICSMNDFEEDEVDIHHPIDIGFPDKPIGGGGGIPIHP